MHWWIWDEVGCVLAEKDGSSAARPADLQYSVTDETDSLQALPQLHPTRKDVNTTLRSAGN